MSLSEILNLLTTLERAVAANPAILPDIEKLALAAAAFFRHAPGAPTALGLAQDVLVVIMDAEAAVAETAAPGQAVHP